MDVISFRIGDSLKIFDESSILSVVLFHWCPLFGLIFIYAITDDFLILTELALSNATKYSRVLRWLLS